jgi:glycine betaine/proline transport system substrate-binding protein
MTDALGTAIDNNEWIVVTGWRPHWMWAKWDLAFLEQDQDVFWSENDIHIYGRSDLAGDKPELAQFLGNMSFTDEHLADLLLQVRESSDTVENIARQWVTNNPTVVESWLTQN